ncbi:MAG TPA: hypothetical protein VGR45_02875 [Stellaceae bacterium]|nr:hypothetical protein [Stellaceae bacterium]
MKITDVTLTLFAWESIPPTIDLRPSLGTADRQQQSRPARSHD